MSLRWPSLYNPGLEILNIEHHEPKQPQGRYLYHHHDVFCFTLYWSLTFHTPLILSCGLYVFLNVIAFPAERPQSRLSRPIARRRKRGVIAGLLGLLVFTALCVAGVVLASAVATYILVGLFRAGKYNMSTWIPFLWAAMHLLIGVLGLWPSIIDII